MKNTNVRIVDIKKNLLNNQFNNENRFVSIDRQQSINNDNVSYSGFYNSENSDYSLEDVNFESPPIVNIINDKIIETIVVDNIVTNKKKCCCNNIINYLRTFSTTGLVLGLILVFIITLVICLIISYIFVSFL